MSSAQEKWNKIYTERSVEPSASHVLIENQHLLPKHGVALDFACGLGGNAMLLAEAGLQVAAWDISAVAISQLLQRVKKRNLIIKAEVRDVTMFPPEPNSLDVLVVSYFLDRELCPALIDAIRPGGLLFYQTYCQQKVSDMGPQNPAYLLADNELLSLFQSMKVRVYREESLLGETARGLRNQAMIILEK